MSLVNYREVANRFTHVDARFVACECGLPENDGFFTVELYAWWEHPLYLAARATRANWGFASLDDAYRRVTVYPRRVHQARLSRREEVTEWDFTQEHPLLWQYEQAAEITCNSSVSLEQWMQLREAVRDKLTGYSRQVELAVYAAPEQVHRWGRTGSFSLGIFPRPLFLIVRQVLDERRISYLASYEPEPVDLPVLFLIDDSDYIIADDFELDVPEFVHKPEWFQPR